jgi:hypothetical protein
LEQSGVYEPAQKFHQLERSKNRFDIEFREELQTKKPAPPSGTGLGKLP